MRTTVLWLPVLISASAAWGLTPAVGASTATVAPTSVFSLTASDGATHNLFGESVAISGNTLVALAPGKILAAGDRAGVAYVYTRAAAGWADATQTAELSLPDHGGGGPNEVAISGDTIVIGDEMATQAGNDSAGYAYVYTEPAGGWASTSTPTATLAASDSQEHAQFGASVAIDGATIVVGAPEHTIGAEPQQGEAYVFTEPAGGWQNTTSPAVLTASDGTAADTFGSAVAVSGDTVVVGAPKHEEPALNGVGTGYVFVKPTTGPWASTVQNRELQPSDTTGVDLFGSAGAVAIDGSTIVIGALGTGNGTFTHPGEAYVYVEPTSAGWGPVDSPAAFDETARLTPSDGANGDHFGASVAISGNDIAVGAQDHSVGTTSQEGEVYQFAEPTSGWTTTSTSTVINAPNGAANEEFHTVALSGATLAVGADQADTATGALYLFTPTVVPPVAPPAALTLTKVSQSHHSWQLGPVAAKLNPKKKPKKSAGGTEFSFTLNQAATVTLRFTEKVHGHGRKLVSKNKGILTVHVKAGHNTVYVDGKTATGKKLVAGHGTVTITGKNGNGTAKAKPLHFTVKKSANKHHEK